MKTLLWLDDLREPNKYFLNKFNPIDCDISELNIGCDYIEAVTDNEDAILVR